MKFEIIVFCACLSPARHHQGVSESGNDGLVAHNRAGVYECGQCHCNKYTFGSDLDGCKLPGTAVEIICDQVEYK